MKNRLVSLVLLPMALLLWMVGWVMSMAALSKDQRGRQTRTSPTACVVRVMQAKEREDG